MNQLTKQELTVMDKFDWSTFGMGVFIGAILMAGIAQLPGSNLSRYHEAMDECQRDLPRSQQCLITAKPKEIGKDSK